jgi:hypothetical protein
VRRRLHEREGPWLERRKPPQRRSYAVIETRMAELPLAIHGRPNDIGTGWDRSAPNRVQQVAAHQCASRLLVEHSGVPSVRRVDEVNALVAASSV